MTNTVSFGVIGSTGKLQSMSEPCAPLSTIVYSTVGGRKSFGTLKSTSSHEVSHLVNGRRTRRRTSAA